MSNDGEKRPGPGEAARRNAETGQGVKPPAERPATPPPRRRPDKPFIPFVGFEDVVAKCGHVEKFGLLPDNKDRFRQDRRKKAMGRDCKACRDARRREQEEAALLRRAEKEKRKVDEEQKSRREKAPGPQTGRLPDGSRFEVSYDAAKERWTGSLTVTTPEGEQTTFSGSGSGLFPLLTSLDRQYRASLK